MAHAGGRPTDYRPEYCEQIIEHMAAGLSKTSFAGIIGVSSDTICEWESRHVEFSAAIKIGHPKRRLYWERDMITADKSTLGRSVFMLKNITKNDKGDEMVDNPEPSDGSGTVIKALLESWKNEDGSTSTRRSLEYSEPRQKARGSDPQNEED